MLEKLPELERKFEQLTEELTEPQVLADPKRLQRTAKERAQLEPLISTFRSHRAVAEEIADAEAMLEDKDPDARALAREELASLRPRLAALERKLADLLAPRDPNDERNVLLEIRAGTGGEEAALFAAQLFRMYARYAERRGWKVELLSSSPSDLGGLKEAIAQVLGVGAYSALRHESGVHRVQRVPVTESSGRIHTSTVTVAVLPEAEEIDVRLEEKDLRVDVMRASGPGGQGVNTTDSAVRLTHLPTGLVVVCQDERSQQKNRARALKILRARLYEMEREKEERARAEARRGQIGSAERSEKIRTYNFPQDRLTDHRVGLTRHNLAAVMDGEIDDVMAACRRLRG